MNVICRIVIILMFNFRDIAVLHFMMMVMTNDSRDDSNDGVHNPCRGHPVNSDGWLGEQKNAVFLNKFYFYANQKTFYAWIINHDLPDLQIPFKCRQKHLNFHFCCRN